MSVLITGSSAGLGRSLAWAFHNRGNQVILHGRNEQRLNELYGEIGLDIVIGDLTDARTIGRLYEVALRHEIDVLVNNAGQYLNGCPAETTPAELEAIIQTNLIAAIRLTLQIYPIFKAKGKGLIVNINSLAGKTFNDREAAYCASKWGLRGFMGSFRHAARQEGIGILDIYLGAMRTGMKNPDGRGLSYSDPREDGFLDPDDVAEAIVNLCVGYPGLRINEVEIGRVGA